MNATVTLAVQTIHNPAEPRHFMKLKPVPARVSVRRGGTILATSKRAVRLLEVGFDLYDPIVYFPPEDVSGTLTKNAASSHCPLKGDATYYDLAGAGEPGLNVAWSYDTPFAFARDIAGLIAFYPSKVDIEERA